MADKPRVKAPKQRTSASTDASSKRRVWTFVAAACGLVLGIGVMAALLGLVGGGGGATDEAGLRVKLESAGCTLKIAPALEGVHSVRDPGGTSDKWNTDPATSGPHYGVAAIFGIYDDELEMARVVHNLEHGGVYILYGKDVPDSTVAELRSFYESHKTGTIMAPLNRLGDQFAVGAWVVDGETDSGFLATCKEFNEGALATFFRTLQYRGPERYDPTDLQPGL